MLVFISDLHFIDGTAGGHNIPAKAFKRGFRDICKSCKNPEEVRIVFLGDVFDLLRTTYWLNVPQDERPWGTNMSAVEGHAKKIMDDILRKNRRTFDIFQDLTKACPLLEEVEKVYIPGNHDRLCNVFPSLRDKVRASLGLPAGTAPFQHLYDDHQYGNKYGVLARHGHEFDQWNYEGTTNHTNSDYAQVPIGDPITTELVAALPYTIMNYVKQSTHALSKRELTALKRNLQEIDNVRPISAVLHWLFYQVRKKARIQNEINQAVQHIVENFNNLDMVKSWYKRHRTLNPFASDSSDMLQAAIEIFKRFNVGALESLVTVFNKIFGSSDEVGPGKADEALINAAQAFLTQTSDYKYVAMGHTHNALEVPIRIASKGMQVYFNTGTWRKRYTQGRLNGFTGTKYLTYTMFYTKRENGKQCFETWTGSLQET